jgi:hypothetical protein
MSNSWLVARKKVGHYFKRREQNAAFSSYNAQFQ